MDPTIVTQIVIAGATLLASLGGFLLAGLNERRRDERTHRRETGLRRLDRAAQLENDTHVLQRETLLALQDALQQSARLTGKAIHFDYMQAREGKYTQLPDGLSDEMHAVGVEVNKLAARVLDPHVRTAIRGFTELSTHLSMLPTDLQGLTGQRLENRGTEKLQELGDGYDAVAEVVGEAVRPEIDWRPGTEAESTRGPA